MNFIAEIDIMPQKALLDPQGKAVTSGLNNMGFKEITSARVGKHITLELTAASEEEASKKVEEACKQLLANQITESFEFKIIAS
jgi:phosphoribosylformylglycinamidine synthase PurS subunit